MISLHNDILKADIDARASLYEHTRFDHAGQIVQVTMHNRHTFLTTETKNPLKRATEGTGLSGEFGIHMPIGYDDCPVGEYFPKIGVGLLLKENTKPYDYFHIYKLKKDTKQIIQESDRELRIISSIEPCRGYAYEYEKRISLDKNQIRISYKLKNTGTKPILTTEYCHNFVGFNDLNLDTNYTLSFDIPLHKNTFKELANPNDCLIFDTNAMSWQSTPKEDFFIGDLGSIKKWQLENTKTKTALSEEVQFTSPYCNVWGNAHVVSPEIFISVDVKANETMQWERLYTFKEI
ncbi:MAG TPA: hypothetical protein PKW26_06225 [Treponemataceae bacterium]|nr:hypothetical protein [Treponemataceae bacterium]HOQ93198.1 hypothetical protein [Treponemataceae bacterium]HPM05878.1 hypothetical protein [Treponemataceae bacterium]